MAHGTPEDMAQEGLFDKTEELTLNYEQVGALLIAIQTQLTQTANTLNFFNGITPEQTNELKMTKEDIETEKSIHNHLDQTLPYMHQELLELAHELEPEDIDKIVSPGLSIEK
jgi:hypothetical protein|tara:strand:+ start:233 stop:571 length:339 start_codon:yes stop_codon:yes gene_type:complete